MLTTVANIILMGFLVETLVQLTKSNAFMPIWSFLLRLTSSMPRTQEQLTYFMQCGYCRSVWTSIFVSALAWNLQCLPEVIPNSLGNFLIVVLVTHRLSNLIHFAIDRVDTSKDVRYTKDSQS